MRFISWVTSSLQSRGGSKLAPTRLRSADTITSFSSFAVIGFAVVGALVGFAFTASVGHGQASALIKPRTAAAVEILKKAPTPAAASAAASDRVRGTTQLVCSMSAFFSTQPDNRLGLNTVIDGRGLLSCRNDQGFSTELPVMIDLQADMPAVSGDADGEITFSGNTSVFVIPREIHQIQDIYQVRDIKFGTAQNSDSPTVLFRGKSHDLVVEMKITSRTSKMPEIKVTGMNLHFDDTAPDLALNSF